MKLICNAHFGAKTTRKLFTVRFTPPMPDFTQPPSLQQLLLVPFTVWAPHITFAGICSPLPCKVAECDGKVQCHGRGQKPRWVRGLSTCELLVSAKYTCAKCHSQFLATDDEFLAKLPAVIRRRAPFWLSHSSGVTKE